MPEVTHTRTGPDSEPVHTHVTHTSEGSSATGIIVGAVVVVLAIIGAMFLFGGDDADTSGTTVNIEATPAPDESAAPTTEVIEPGAADGGADVPITTEPNEAGTAADPAVGGDAEATTGN